MYLYRTQIGVKVMDWFASKFKRAMKPIEYVVVTSGYILMVAMVWLLIRFTIIYSKAGVAEQLKIPPVLPLFPYATDLFNVPFLPPFYFTYWIVIIAIIAISHEFAHGIFARLNNIKVQSTGFGFLGPFLAAFVEPDEKQMEKAPKFAQLSILAAGTFANVLMTILFGLIMWLFFVSSFSAAGVQFNAYPQAVVELNSIESINGIEIGPGGILNSLNGGDELIEVVSNGEIYLIPEANLRGAVENEEINAVTVFENSPAIKANLKSPILMIDDVVVRNFDELRSELDSKSPGDEIRVKSIVDDEEVYHNIVLGDNNGEAYLGIGIQEIPRTGISGTLYGLIEKVKSPFVYYEANWSPDFAWFIYNLLWWTVLINISVALVNMLPVGIFDGGRFFYLTIWGITGKENWGRRAFAFATWAMIGVLIWLMVKWAISVF